MKVLMQISGNLVAFILLATVVRVANRRLEKRDQFYKLFIGACRLVLAALFLEALVCVLDGRSSAWVKNLLQILFTMLYMLPPVLAWLWVLLARALTDDGCQSNRLMSICWFPVSVSLGMALFSAHFHWLFFIDDSNVYHRGPLFPVFLMITAGCLLMGFVVLVRHRSTQLRGDFTLLGSIYLFPLLGGALQVLFCGVLLMWSLTAGSLMIMYMYLQERMIQIDSLTGALTRLSFGQHFSKMTGKCRKEPIGILFLDLDEFKAINDRYGHLEGDAALRAFSEIVRSQLRKSDVFARLGGDEFVIVASVGGQEDLQAIKRKIESALEGYNQTSHKPYRLECSIGSKVFDNYFRVQAALADVDRLMYEQKQAKKAV